MDELNQSLSENIWNGIMEKGLEVILEEIGNKHI
jgi:hypothetical protein